MLTLKINLKIALDLTYGPLKEEMEFNKHSEIISLFRNFPEITVTENKVLKTGIPIGEIYEATPDTVL